MVSFTYLKELTKNNLDFKALVLLNRKAGEGGSQESRSIKGTLMGPIIQNGRKRKATFSRSSNFQTALSSNTQMPIACEIHMYQITSESHGLLYLCNTHDG